MELYQIIIYSTSFLVIYMMAVYFARRLSKKVKESTEKTRELKEKIGTILAESKEKDEIIAKKTRELESYKAELEEREKRITELKEFQKESIKYINVIKSEFDEIRELLKRKKGWRE